jgi:hypothetical protein
MLSALAPLMAVKNDLKVGRSTFTTPVVEAGLVSGTQHLLDPGQRPLNVPPEQSFTAIQLPAKLLIGDLQEVEPGTGA